MKEEKFKVIQFIREFLLAIDKQMDNFPKKDIEIKNRIRNVSFDLLEVAYKANSTSDIKYKLRLIEDIIGMVKVLDFLFNLCYEKEIINSKRYIKFGLRIDDIIKYTTGWKNNILKGIDENE